MTTFQQQTGFIEPTLARLAEACAGRDAVTFDSLLAQLVAYRSRTGEGDPGRLLDELQRITVDLQRALERFSSESRLADFARRDIPDARARLEHVLRLTDAAAHRTLDLIERSATPVALTAASARLLLERLRSGERPDTDEIARLLERTVADMDAVRGNLAEAVVAQGYQDLTGQIVRSVIMLVGELEQALAELWRLGGEPPPSREDVEGDRRGYGPRIPGVDDRDHIDAQQDVDDLLSDLGM